MSENASPTPVIYDHCKTVYEEMLDKAHPEVVDDDTIMVYEGHLTKLFQELRLSTPYYTSVMKNLKRMACVEQLRRGGGNAPSKWQLVKEPNEEEFRQTAAKRPRKDGRVAALEQQVRDQNNRLLTIEKALNLVGSD